MQLVIDTNRIMASLLKDGLSRSLIYSESFDFFTPDKALDEIAKYKIELCEKAHITPEQFDVLLIFIFKKITVVPQEEYLHHLPQANKLIADKDDAPFLALALTLKLDGVWTEDNDFLQQKKVKIYSTKEMITFGS